jgi:hypothetical protein
VTDVEKLIARSRPDIDLSIPEMADILAAFCAELAEQLKTKAAQKAAKNNRGHKSYGEHIATAVVELNAIADALRKHAATSVPAEPVVCRAVDNDGAPCIRTEPGHQAHTYATALNTALATDEVLDTPSGPITVEQGPYNSIIPTAVCGIEDRYTTHDAGHCGPDRCVRPPHGRDTGHEGAWSKWPWQDDDKPFREQLAEPKDPDPATIAYLKGERDDLGTEPLFIEPRSTVTVSGMAQGGPVAMGRPHVIHKAELYSWGPTLQPSVFPGAGIVSVIPAVPDLNPYPPSELIRLMKSLIPIPIPEAAVPQPDPFDNALPEAPKREGVWTGGAEPVAPDPRPLWLPDTIGSGLPLTEQVPRSIRTTQVRTGEACGLQYRLISRDQVPEVPSWANIGGSALHACANRYELTVLEGMAAETIDEATARAWWAERFMAEIHSLEAATPFPRSTWRRAGKGAEGEDWWNEVGPLMVRDYSAASAGWHAEGWSILPVPSNQPGQRASGQPAMELELRTPLMQGELTGHLDQAWFRNRGGGEFDILIRDLKSGREMPEDDWQLEAYVFGLRHRLATAGMNVSRIVWSAVYYDARNGKDGEVKTPRMDSAEITYRAGAVLGMHAANNYPANPGTTWKAPCYLCPVRYACPIMATRG